MINYDAIIVLAPGLTEEKMDSLLAKFEKKIVDNGGEAGKTEKWGMKRLNFEFKKHKGIREGFYLLMQFGGTGKAVIALRDTLRLQEEVIRQIITRAPEAPAPEEAEIFPEVSTEQAGGRTQ